MEFTFPIPSSLVEFLISRYINSPPNFRLIKQTNKNHSPRARKNQEIVVLNNLQRLADQEAGVANRDMSGPNLRIPLPNGNIMKIPIAARPINISEEVDKTAIWKKVNEQESDSDTDNSKRSNKYFGWASRGWIERGWGEEESELDGGGRFHHFVSFCRISSKKHKNIKKKTSPKTDKRLTTMREEEETLTRNDDSKMGLVGQA